MVSTSSVPAAPQAPAVASAQPQRGERPTGDRPPSNRSSILTATLVDGVLALAARDGEVVVRVPLDPALAAPASADAGVPGTIARVCALDSALARRLFRRVSAWRPDGDGNLAARVRPTV